MKPGETLTVDLDDGKRLFIKLMQAADQVDEQGRRSVFFELNGVPRSVSVKDKVCLFLFFSLSLSLLIFFVLGCCCRRQGQCEG